jgi:hypothetical protein
MRISPMSRSKRSQGPTRFASCANGSGRNHNAVRCFRGRSLAASAPRMRAPGRYGPVRDRVAAGRGGRSLLTSRGTNALSSGRVCPAAASPEAVRVAAGVFPGPFYRAAGEPGPRYPPRPLPRHWPRRASGKCGPEVAEPSRIPVFQRQRSFVARALRSSSPGRGTRVLRRRFPSCPGRGRGCGQVIPSKRRSTLLENMSAGASDERCGRGSKARRPDPPRRPDPLFATCPVAAASGS